MKTAIKVMFYVQHLLGIGHLARASLVAKALADDGFDITLIMGGDKVPGFPDAAIPVIELPALRAGPGGFSDLVTPTGIPVDDAFKGQRRDQLLRVFDDLKPDVLIIEAFPFGRRQVRFELLPLLDHAQAQAIPPLIVSSVRDILQAQRKPERNDEMRDLALKYFDMVLVHGDKDFAAFGDSFIHGEALEPIVRYSGLVAGSMPPLAGPSYDGVISAGGGAAGAGLMAIAGEAIARSTMCDHDWALITGPNLASDLHAELADKLPRNITVTNLRTDFRAVLAAAELSVSQAGYNTVCDLLQARCRSILVPFASGGETEQGVRADKLCQRGFADQLSEADLNPSTLAAAINGAYAKPRPNIGNLPQLNGAKRSTQLIRDALIGKDLAK